MNLNPRSPKKRCVMKWEKVERIEFDHRDLPDEVYAKLVPVIMNDVVVNLYHDACVGAHHEWDDDSQYDRCLPIVSLVKNTLEDIDTCDLPRLRHALKVCLELATNAKGRQG
jgi:hypothetical protein